MAGIINTDNITLEELLEIQLIHMMKATKYPYNTLYDRAVLHQALEIGFRNDHLYAFIKWCSEILITHRRIRNSLLPYDHIYPETFNQSFNAILVEIKCSHRDVMNTNNKFRFEKYEVCFPAIESMAINVIVTIEEIIPITSLELRIMFPEFSQQNGDSQRNNENNTNKNDARSQQSNAQNSCDQTENTTSSNPSAETERKLATRLVLPYGLVRIFRNIITLEKRENKETADPNTNTAAVSMSENPTLTVDNARKSLPNALKEVLASVKIEPAQNRFQGDTVESTNSTGFQSLPSTSRNFPNEIGEASGPVVLPGSNNIPVEKLVDISDEDESSSTTTLSKIDPFIQGTNANAILVSTIRALRNLQLSLASKENEKLEDNGSSVPEMLENNRSSVPEMLEDNGSSVPEALPNNDDVSVDDVSDPTFSTGLDE